MDHPILMDAPLGAPAFVVFFLLLFQLTARVLFLKLWQKIGQFILTLGLFTALSLTLADVLLISSKSILFVGDGLVKPSLAIILFFPFLSQISRLFSDIKKEEDFRTLELVALFLAMIALQAGHHIVLVIVLPTLFLVMATHPMIANKLIGIRSLTKGVIYAIVASLVLAGLGFFLLDQYGSMNFFEIRSKTLVLGSEKIVMVWAVGLFIINSLLFLSPLALFDQEVEAVGDWLDVLSFRWFFLLFSSLMSLRWTYLLAKREVTSGGWSWIEIGEVNFSNFYFYFLVLLAALVVFRLYRSRNIFSFFTSLLVLSVCMAQMAFLTGLKTCFTAGLLLLFVFSLVANVLALTFSQLRVPLLTAIEKSELLIKWDRFYQMPVLLTVIFLVLPFGNVSTFFLIKESYPAWRTQLPNTLPLMFMATLFLLILISIFSSLQKMRGESDVDSAVGVDADCSLWNYILLIPLIILGIYPHPLYNYVQNTLAGF